MLHHSNIQNTQFVFLVPLWATAGVYSDKLQRLKVLSASSGKGLEIRFEHEKLCLSPQRQKAKGTFIIEEMLVH